MCVIAAGVYKNSGQILLLLSVIKPFVFMCLLQIQQANFLKVHRNCDSIITSSDVNVQNMMAMKYKGLIIQYKLAKLV